ncbi:DNA mismatch repair protein [Macrophomina phaseolina MS6]|uniref:DNA mismatch repair protein n=1 Tax=Macrophomina phaseolina (strain MS6) TaxID=1126212 RepID=K2S9K7_MACPH|nr:DNA mismatch repair protein [Macrophomina phaseolina MS6]
MNLEPQQHVNLRQRSQRPIAPLPPDVVAQIKSSTAITSLTAAVLGLVQNSLDSGATKIEISVDAWRGGCTVEDNGLGILPSEFREEGGLGKPYCTSRHNSDELVYGRHGTFLASLAALSLLTITSHHCQFQSHNTVTLHRSQVIARHLPAPRQHELTFRDHGTRVTVRDLFGTMPVRVKQRATLLDDRAEQERQWESLKKLITGLLLAWQTPVSLRVRDLESTRTLSLIANHKQPVSVAERLSWNERKVHAALRSLVATLSQASYIAPDEWSSWVPASASTDSITINGAISVKPAPSKSVQFFSVGIRPIFSNEGHNELFDEINRLFNNSSFGVVEDDPELDEREKERRLQDKRHKTDGPTKRQLRSGRKGIDRWPKFYLHVRIVDGDTNEDEVLDSESKLHSILEVLRAMVTQWLQVHNFGPRSRQPRNIGSRPESVSSRASTPTSQDQGCSQPLLYLGEDSIAAAEVNSFTSKKRKRSSERPNNLNPATNPNGMLVASDWSRIKSGKSAFYEDVWSSKKPTSVPFSNQSNSQTPSVTVSGPGSARESPGQGGIASSFFEADPVMPGELGSLHPRERTLQSVVVPDRTKFDETGPKPTKTSNHDASIKWTDPHTNETYTINSRTGTIMDNEARQCGSAPSSPSRIPASIAGRFSKALSLSRKPATAPSQSGGQPWLENFLADWNNPVFRPQTSTIRKITLPELSDKANALLHSHNGHSSHTEIGQAFAEVSALGQNKLSKQGLRKAEVVAQVDRKFILVAMEATKPTAATVLDCSMIQPKRLLVIIDQHAADERCRVEELFAELCLPRSAEDGECRSELGHMSRIKTSVLSDAMYFEVSAEEARLLEMYAGYFADWGIVYDLNKSGARQILMVRTLPPGVSERCQADPKLLLSLLRSETWRLADDRTQSAAAAARRTNNPAAPKLGSMKTKTEPHSWLAEMGSCPRGILELLNSRACRSAVMFNDKLSVAQCEDVVTRLARCAFPFQCAHGRPSMVPLVDLGTAAVEQGRDETFKDPGRTTGGEKRVRGGV